MDYYTAIMKYGSDGLWLPTLDYELPISILPYAQSVDYTTPKPLTHLSIIDAAKVVAKESYAVTELRESVQDYLKDRTLNHIIIMSAAGVIVLTEEKLEPNEVMFKLTTGANFVGCIQIDLAAWVTKLPDLITDFPEIFRR